MKHWEFLIQKQGERSWTPLESTNVELEEGRYRVVARSDLANTDVEVRVMHQTTQQVPPSRRVQKRLRRTNAEGLMAVVPFTYLKPGIWELRCSASLMSEFLGQSWQHGIKLLISPSKAPLKKPDDLNQIEEEVESLEEISIDTLVIKEKTEPESSFETPQTIFVQTQDAIASVETVPSLLVEIEDEIANAELAEIVNAGDNVENTEIIEREQVISVTVISPINNNIQGKLTQNGFTVTEPEAGVPVNFTDLFSVAPKEELETATPETTTEKTLEITPETTTEKTLEITPETTTEPTPETTTETTTETTLEITTETTKLNNSEPTETTPVEPIASVEIIDTEVPEIAITLSNRSSALVRAVQSLAASNEIDTDTDIIDAVLDDTPSQPAWLSGTTAEQLLQNLVELALPLNDPLLFDSTIFESPEIVQPPQPLVLTLDTNTYIARWGEALIISGRIDQPANTKLSFDDDSEFQRVCFPELVIELRSPNNLQFISQVRQPLPEKLLPYTFTSLIEIPKECESKLILADINLYGTIPPSRDIKLLASQSFTITGDLTELLAAAIASKRKLEEIQNAPTVADDSETTATEAESVSLDLELFNIVKTRSVKQPVVRRNSSKKAIPPQIDPIKFRKSRSRLTSRSPKLPNFSKGQPETMTAVVDPTTPPDSLIAADIELEDTYKTFPSISSNTFLPFLKRIKVLPPQQPTSNFDPVEDVSTVEEVEAANTIETVEQLEQFSQQEAVSTNELELQQAPTVLFSPNLAQTAASEQPTVLIVENTDNNRENFADNLPVITTPPAPYTSPLIKKWMEAQGLTASDPAYPQYQDNNTFVVSAANTVFQQKPHFVIDEVDENTAPQEEVQVQIATLVEKADVRETESEISSPEEPFVKSKLPIPPPPPPPRFAKPAWVEREIVVDDTEDEPLVESPTSDLPASDREPTAANDSILIPIVMLEYLPIPELYLPTGEFIAGKSILVRVKLPQVSSQVAIKLWVEDCQTRWLLDGPHVLTNMSPTKSGGKEVTTQLHVPFGCMSIRIEAIAIDLTSLQESHKVSVVRSVIPPDLPSFQLDELLGI